MTKFELTKKEQKLFSRASALLSKSEELQREFYDSIEQRFEKAGYDGDFVLDTLISSDAYVFSESGCSGDFLEYHGYEDVWDYIANNCPKRRKETKE